MPTYRTAEAVKASAIQFLDAVRRQVMTADGEPMVDLVDAVSLELERGYVLQEYVKLSMTTDGFRSVIADESFKEKLAGALGVSYTTLTLARSLGVPDDLANDVEAVIYYDISQLGKTVGCHRKDATKATVIERLVLSSGSAFSLAAGAIVRAGGDVPVNFETVSDIDNVSPGFDAAGNYYYVDASMRASFAGLSGNRSKQTITVLSTALPGVVRAFNPATSSGGADVETNDALLDRIDEGALDQSVATQGGLARYLRDQSLVQDCYVVGAGSSYASALLTGEVHAYVIVSASEAVQSTCLENPTDHIIVLPLQPVLSITAVHDLEENLLSPGTDYVIWPADDSYAGSTHANTRIEIVESDYWGEQLVIDYTVNSAIRDLQSPFEGGDEDLMLPGGIVIVRLAEELLVDVRMLITPVAGTGLSAGQIQTLVENDVISYFSTLQLASRVTILTVGDVVEAVQYAGEDVIMRVEDLEIRISGGTFGVSDLQANDLQYHRLDTLTFL